MTIGVYAREHHLLVESPSRLSYPVVSCCNGGLRDRGDDHTDKSIPLSDRQASSQPTSQILNETQIDATAAEHTLYLEPRVQLTQIVLYTTKKVVSWRMFSFSSAVSTLSACSSPASSVSSALVHGYPSVRRSLEVCFQYYPS